MNRQIGSGSARAGGAYTAAGFEATSVRIHREHVHSQAAFTRRDIMDDNKALAIVSALANGVNPQTGEMFEADSPYQSADVIRALYVAARALEMSSRSKARASRARTPANAGKPWTEKEDRELLERFDAGLSVAELAQAHDRTMAGIQARLERHGRVQGQGLQWRGHGTKTDGSTG
jgi:hypothetical protein